MLVTLDIPEELAIRLSPLEEALGSFNGIDRRGFQNSLQDVKLCPKKPCLPAK